MSGGALYIVDPAAAEDGQVEADRVSVSGVPADRQVTAGDGLVLRGTRLYVVRMFAQRNSVVELRLDQRDGTASYVREITDPSFDVPTTAALVAGDPLVVNGRFTTLPAEPDAEVYVTRIDL